MDPNFSKMAHQNSATHCLTETMKSNIFGKVLDLRSDTITHPTQKMREAMFSTPCGDDVYEEDEPTNDLQAYAASLAGKQAALLVPSGSMSNLISVWNHCNVRGSDCIVGDRSHIHMFEQGSMSTVAGVYSRHVRNLMDGRLDIDEVERCITPENIHFSRTRLICVENTHNFCGGKVIPMDHILQLRHLADKHNIKLHLDGARVFNASTRLNISLKELCEPFDSINICLSKGLAAPIGSLLIGSQEFITESRHIRKALGGAMRQTGILAAAALISLKEMTKRLHIDHENAMKFANGIKQLKDFGLQCDYCNDTNIVFFKTTHHSADDLIYQLCHPEDSDAPLVKMNKVDSDEIRVVTHYEISSEDIDFILERIQDIVKSQKKQSIHSI